MKTLTVCFLFVIYGALAQEAPKPEEKKIAPESAIKLENLELKMTNLWMKFQQQQKDYNEKMQAFNKEYESLMGEVRAALGVGVGWQYSPEEKKFVKQKVEDKKGETSK